MNEYISVLQKYFKLQTKNKFYFSISQNIFVYKCKTRLHTQKKKKISKASNFK